MMICKHDIAKRDLLRLVWVCLGCGADVETEEAYVRRLGGAR